MPRNQGRVSRVCRSAAAPVAIGVSVIAVAVRLIAPRLPYFRSPNDAYGVRISIHRVDFPTGGEWNLPQGLIPPAQGRTRYESDHPRECRAVEPAAPRFGFARLVLCERRVQDAAPDRTRLL